MSVSSGTPTLTPAESADGVWHALPTEEVLRVQGVDRGTGLSSGEAASRALRFGPNRFAEARVEPRWRAFARQYATRCRSSCWSPGRQPVPAQGTRDRNAADRC